MVLVYALQLPVWVLLSARLYSAFQDLRMLLVPAFLVAAHLGLSCLLLYTNSVIFHVLRDIIGTIAASVLLSLLVWTLPGAIEWVGDDEMTDLQAIADVEPLNREAREAAEIAAKSKALGEAFPSLYDAN
eukprot:CAMPEP_0206226332 /NCGR_PEP_ID=MMETSP0047_2-20121206/8044_1 /ASSEMBLY_ACC=CAM_ASM_000192 /TAXON_ID=195065 /ORGANISM="Chroomonas mesostigmatica_cf, Strain CCMP1168" /LENGTH=129 /DNA_ID=CAMNT_0053649431 /DNA_START=92 /DNA_END=478 /DNA_ORIENTATION=+